MNTSTWFIIGLVVLCYAQYNWPEKVEFVGYVFDPVNDFVSGLVPSWFENVCPEDNAPVCANGQTYQNICFATKAGAINVTAGACND